MYKLRNLKYLLKTKTALLLISCSIGILICEALVRREEKIDSDQPVENQVEDCGHLREIGGDFTIGPGLAHDLNQRDEAEQDLSGMTRCAVSEFRPTNEFQPHRRYRELDRNDATQRIQLPNATFDLLHEG